MSQTGTILIVDDLLAVREVLKGLLTGQGYDLVFADNGPEALSKAKEIIPDLILLDVMMPDMDGFEVCRHLRTDELLAEVPIVMVTALDDHDSLLRGIEAGADDFLSKPFNHAELRARVGTIIRLNRYRRLLAARTKFDWVVEQTKDGYLVIDDQDNILYANPQARLYLGLSASGDDLSAATFLDLATNHYSLEPQITWENWPVSCQPASSPRYLVQAETLTAQAFWLQVETLALPPGSGEGQVIHLSDVTLQVTLQRDIWEFQAMVAHKLRTPVTSIYSGLHLMEEEDTSAWKPGTVKLFDIICRGAERLHHEVEDILEYLQTSDLAGPGAGFKLTALQLLTHQLGLDLKLEPITIHTAAELREAHLALHPQAVELLLWETFENSRKFHPQKSPKIEISVALAENKSVLLQIKDDGVHLSPEQLTQVWTPFYQADKYLTGEIDGMGLGLSKVALLLWNAGGTCRIYNRTETAGVVVEFVLPLTGA
ncbi:MAG TPA: response regulator [Anaerolineae bacterium]